MEVNKGIYDDLLKRRERARVSMSLDIEGQGMNYKINETAQYPTSPVGPKFPMFCNGRAGVRACRTVWHHSRTATN